MTKGDLSQACKAGSNFKNKIMLKKKNHIIESVDAEKISNNSNAHL